MRYSGHISKENKDTPNPPQYCVRIINTYFRKDARAVDKVPVTECLPRIQAALKTQTKKPGSVHL